jgi:hypothetical protein
MRPEEIQEWSVDNFWILVLLAKSYHFECVSYRAVKERCDLTTDSLSRRSAMRLQNAMFELNTTIDRTLLHRVASFCPVFLWVFE